MSSTVNVKPAEAAEKPQEENEPIFLSLTFWYKMSFSEA